MNPLIPFFLALVCSIFGTTSELTNHDRNQVSDSAIYWDQPKYTYGDKHTQIYRKGQNDIKTRAKRETSDDPRCKPFEYKEGQPIRHPKEPDDTKNNLKDNTYSSHTTCFTSIEATVSHVIVLTFVDKFEMEDPVRSSNPPSCKHDYLEIRDGQFGYALPVYTFCGKEFPPTITSTGPFLWLKFKSDESIEYSGFTIDVAFQTSTTSQRLPVDCFMSITKQKSGIIDSLDDAKKCRDLSTGGAAVDFQWKIETEPDTQIYLNFTQYKLAKPNECDANVVQVFGAEPNFDHKLNSFCGSVPRSLTTNPANGNIMYIRMYTKDKTSTITAQFTAFRVMQQGEDECNLNSEFNCLDGTCIDKQLKCDGTANCRLKADEDPAICKTVLQSEENDPQMILIIFSLIMSVMITIFLVKCVLKVYRDQKQINEHLLNHGPLDKLSEINLSFDPIRMTMEPEPRASLERENHTNEMYKQQRNKRKSSSLESESLRQSTSPDRNEWPESVPILSEDIRIEHKGRTRSDSSKREESLRSPKDEWNENRGVSFEVPDTQESGCQTRDSLFQVDPVPSSGSNSGSNSHGPSTFGFSGATIARPSSLRLSTAPASPPPRPLGFSVAPISSRLNSESNSRGITTFGISGATSTSSLHLSIVPATASFRPRGFAVVPINSHADRRPMSNETTRSAPDVIIVSKPIN